MSNRETKTNLNLKLILFGIGIISAPLTILIIYRLSISPTNLIPLSLLALIAGAVIGNKTLTQKWSTFFYTTLYSFVFSLLSFFPAEWLGWRKNSSDVFTYNLDRHITVWPYIFLAMLIIAAIATNKDKITSKLSESITLLMSVSFIYWIIDYGVYNITPAFLKIIVIVGFIIAGFSIINAFINIPLNKYMRLFLSIWSSILMALLAIDNIYILYQAGQIEEAVLLSDKISIGLQYFSLGLSGAYIFRNLLMIIDFYPGKIKSYNKETKRLIADHVSRYSDQQAGFSLSLLCLIFSISSFAINHTFNLTARDTAIWLVFFLSTSLIYSYNKKLKPTEVILNK